MNIELVQPQLGLKISISNALLAMIYEEVLENYPNECGGIFIGEYAEDLKSVKIIEFILPNIIKGAPHLFTRESKYLNKAIKHIYEESKGEQIYVGEWHSHPKSTSKYSEMDLKTMRIISSQKNIRISMPILLIVGYHSNMFDASFYVMYNNNLLKYEPTIYS